MYPCTYPYMHHVPVRAPIHAPTTCTCTVLRSPRPSVHRCSAELTVFRGSLAKLGIPEHKVMPDVNSGQTGPIYSLILGTFCRNITVKYGQFGRTRMSKLAIRTFLPKCIQVYKWLTAILPN